MKKNRSYLAGLPLFGAMLTMSCNAVAAFDGGLIPNGDFASGLTYWTQSFEGTLRNVMLNGVSTQMMCMPEKRGAEAGPGSNIDTTRFDPLLTNTRYRLSFDAVRDNSMLGSGNLNHAKPGIVRVAVRNDFARQYHEEIYGVANVSDSAGKSKRITIDFVTPEVDVFAATPQNSKVTSGVPFASRTKVFLMSGAEVGPTGGDICVKNVKLTPVPEFASLLKLNQVGLGKNGSLNFTLETNLPYVSWVLVKNADGPNPVRMSILGPKSAIEPTVMTVKDYQPLAEKPYLDALTGKYVSRVSVPLANIQNLEFDTDYTVYFNYIGGLSNPQKIRISSKSVYADLKYDALQFFYFQRSGEAINDLTGPTYRADGQRDRPAGNVVENASCFTGADKHGNYHKGCVLPNGPIDVSGGWYDAADTGKYVVNAGISLWTLQNMIERLQSKRIKDGSGTVVNLGGAESIGGGNAPGAFVDGSMAYPANPKWPNPVGSTALLVDKVGEVNTPISDLMNEARHEMKFLLKMQAPVGTKASVPLGMQDIDWNSIYGVRVAGTTPATGDIGPQVPLGYQTLQFTEVDVSGMAFHSVHDPVWTPVPTWPHASPYQHLRVLETPTTAATLALAATGAQCYRIWKKLDPSFANTCLTAAKKAWAAVTQKYPVTATSVAPVTASIYQYGEYSNVKTLGKDGGPLPAIIDGAGAYADTNVKDEFSWAGMELYLATTSDTISVNGAISTDATPLPGDYFKVATTNAQSKCGSRFPIACENWVNSMRWGNVAPLGTLSALTALPGVFTAPTVKITNFDGGATIRDLDPSPLAQIKTRAELFLGQIATSAYGVPKDSSTYDWGSNADIMNAGLILGIAADVTAGTSAATKYRNGVASTMDYLLGRNSLGKSFVSGYGNNPVMNPHHRVWAKQANIYMKAVPPGVVVGGPNGQAKAGAVGAGRTRASTDKPLYTNGTKEIFLNTGVVTTPENIGDKNIPIDYAAVDYLKTILPACGVYTMQCYADNVKSFHSNEVALNWNAPLFWMAQFLDEQGM